MKPRLEIGLGLMLMSFGSGCMDILSYRFLGEVFPSAMTGNVALMGLSIGQGNVGAAVRNLCAFGGFFSGLLLGAVLLQAAPGRRRFLVTIGLQAVVLLAFALLWDRHGVTAWRYGLIGCAAVGMGLQSAVAHRIGVAGVTTTYFTGTLNNIAFALTGRSAAGAPSPAIRRWTSWPVLAFLSYLAGAVIAGWYIAGRDGIELPIGLPMLPLAATVILAAIIALERPRRA